MPRSPVDVVVTQFRYTTTKVNQRVKEKKLVNGRYQTVYVNKTVPKKTMTRDTVILPVTPEQVSFSRERSYDDVPTVNKTIHTRSGSLGRRTITLESFFTNRGTYLQTRQRQFGFKSAREHALWFDARLGADTWLIELRSTALGIRGFYNLRQLRWNTEGGTADLPYTMTWVERNVPKVTVRTFK